MNRHLGQSPIRQAALGLAVLGVTTWLHAGCSISDIQASPIEDYPPELFATQTTTTAEPQPELQRYEMPLYFIDDEAALVLVERPWPDEPTMQNALDALSGGPTEDERAENQGIRSEMVGLDLVPRVESFSNGELRIRVGPRLREMGTDKADRLKLVVTQFTCTSVAVNADVVRVRLVDEEGSIPFSGPTTTPIDVSSVDAVGGCQTAEELAAQQLPPPPPAPAPTPPLGGPR